MRTLLRLTPVLFAVPALAQATPDPGQAQRLGTSCAQALHDADGGGCIEASRVPALGRLVPQSIDLHTDPFNGFVSMGHQWIPLARLDVEVAPTDPTTLALYARSSTTDATGVFGTAEEPGGGGTPIGVQGSTPTGSGTGVFGTWGNFARLAARSGVSGCTTGAPGLSSAGVTGIAAWFANDDHGVYGKTDSADLGVGVLGEHTSTAGTGAGVLGETNSGASHARGVHGVVTDSTPAAFSAGVRGTNAGTGGLGIGVYGEHAGTGYGVYGETAGAGWGVVGSTPPGGFALFGFGDTGATGTKSFVQPHPTDPSKELRFVALEGNEAGTYFRGSARVDGGAGVIVVPEAFRLTSEPTAITVQLTKRGPGDLWVASSDLERVVVRGTEGLAFDYLVQGVRRGYADFEPVRPNRTFVPRQREVPFGAQLAPALRALLVANGTLRADFTPDETTAARLSWTLSDPPRDADRRPGRPATVTRPNDPALLERRR